MNLKHIKWADNIIDPIIKRPCRCMCCLGCNKNGVDCEKFGPYYCIKCEEWRCERCYNQAKKECKNCLYEWK